MRNTRAAIRRTTMVQKRSSDIDRTSCQNGTPPEGRRIIIVTGAVHGKIESATASGPCGWSTIADRRKNGNIADSEISAAHWFASWNVETVEPSPSMMLAKKK